MNREYNFVEITDSDRLSRGIYLSVSNVRLTRQVSPNIICSAPICNKSYPGITFTLGFSMSVLTVVKLGTNKLYDS